MARAWMIVHVNLNASDAFYVTNARWGTFVASASCCHFSRFAITSLSRLQIMSGKLEDPYFAGLFASSTICFASSFNYAIGAPSTPSNQFKSCSNLSNN